MAVSFCVQAQYVTIPDVNFRNELIAMYPSCFNGAQQMDTTCNWIVNTNYLNVNSKSIADLDGIQYFDGLLYLYSKGNQIASLLILPNSLNELYCSSNQLTSLPLLPSSLNVLYCDSNQLSSLPPLPNSLFSLSIKNQCRLVKGVKI